MLVTLKISCRTTAVLVILQMLSKVRLWFLGGCLCWCLLCICFRGSILWATARERYIVGLSSWSKCCPGFADPPLLFCLIMFISYLSTITKTTRCWGICPSGRFCPSSCTACYNRLQICSYRNTRVCRQSCNLSRKRPGYFIYWRISNQISIACTLKLVMNHLECHIMISF